MKSSSIPTRYLALVSALLLLTIVASRLSAHRRSESLAQPLESISRQMAGFIGVDNPPLDAPTLHALQATSYLTRTYRKGTLQADVFLSYYAQQRAGESMHSPKHCLPGAGWEIWNYGSAAIPVAGRQISVNRYSISREGERRLVLYWYQSQGRIIASEYWGKVLLARDALLHNSTAASIVRITVPDEPGAIGAANQLASELIPQVQRCFGN